MNNVVIKTEGIDPVDSEDYIVEESPIYVSKTLANSLYVFQYPSKIAKRDLDMEKIYNCGVKPKTEEVKVSLELNTYSDHYDTFKGQMFVVPETNSNNKAKKVQTESSTMEKITLKSSKVTSNVKKYAMCYWNEGEMHLIPIKNILQLRPSLSHFDKQDNKVKEDNKNEEDLDVMDDEQPKQVTIQFAKKENERQRKAREQSYEYLSKQSNSDIWYHAMWYQPTSDRSVREKRKLTAEGEQSESTQQFVLNKSEYVDQLVPPKLAENIDTLLPSSVVCKKKRVEMKLVDQLKIILRDGKVMRFNKIMSELKGINTSPEKVLQILPTIAVLVCGNWILNSEFLYPENTVSGNNGVPAEYMCKARDYTLYKFTESKSLFRQLLANVVQIPPQEMLEILKTVARPGSQKNWVLLQEPDGYFIDKYSSIVQQQELLWQSKGKTLQEMELDKSPKRARKKSYREQK